MTTRTGTADLPLHGGRVPQWLARRMSALGAAVVEALVEDYGRQEVLTRLSDPYWFQAFGCLLGMDWHSSGITTSVMGALKRGLRDRQKSLGIYVCGGRGGHSRKTPDELEQVGMQTGLDGQRLARISRLVAKVDGNALQDGFGIYLHSFVVTKEGDWAIVQQGMNPKNRTARRYHWRSERVRSFVEEPHEAIFGHNVGTILNLTDRRAKDTRVDLVEFTKLKPAEIVREASRLKHLELPRHHEVRPSDVVLKRLHATLEVARDLAPADFADLLLVPRLGPRTLAALALLAEVLHDRPSRFHDPARYAFAHGGKDGHPHPVLTDVYDRTIHTLRQALNRAKLGDREKIEALKRLDNHRRFAETRTYRRPGIEELSRQGWKDAPHLGGRIATGGGKTGQLSLPLPRKKNR